MGDSDGNGAAGPDDLDLDLFSNPNDSVIMICVRTLPTHINGVLTSVCAWGGSHPVAATRPCRRMGDSHTQGKAA